MMMSEHVMQEKDEGSSEETLGAYECGHWIWDDEQDQLRFISDIPEDEEGFYILPPKTVAVVKVEFNDDIDVFEQQRFKKRYQRKCPQVNDVVLLQDIVDLVLYTAPQEILSPSIIKILHLSATEIFLRALIFFCQYYLQVDTEMERRVDETKFKIPTRFSYEIEDQLKEDLADLRLLVAKEYTAMLLGDGAMRYFHHMGPNRTSASLSQKDIDMNEILIKISVQIVWIALGRQNYNKIEMEVNRLFKSNSFNTVEHKLKTNYVSDMTREQRRVLLGGDANDRCSKYNRHSPLLNELLSTTHATEYQKFGLGKIQYPQTGESRYIVFQLIKLFRAKLYFLKHNVDLIIILSNRLIYMERALVAPEHQLRDMNVSVGILGLPRTHFDIMLREIRITSGTSSVSISRLSRSKSPQSRSFSNRSQSSKVLQKRIIRKITLPPRDDEYTMMTSLPESFPQKKLLQARNVCLYAQRQKWLDRHARLTQKNRPKRAKSPKSLAILI